MVALVAFASRSLPIERPQNPNGPARLSRIKITRQNSANRRTYFFNSIGQSRHSKGAVVTSDLHPTPDISLRRIIGREGP
jgi:hypothetical protein